MENQEKILMTEFDMKFQGNNLQLMKVLIPYIDIKQQKTISIMIKLFEFTNTLNYFKNNKNDISICNTENIKKNPLDMLNMVKEYCSKSQRESIEMVINLLNTMEMVNTYRDMMDNFDLSSFQNKEEGKDGQPAENPDFNINPMDMMKHMLTPEQQAMFDTYSSLLNTPDTSDSSDNFNGFDISDNSDSFDTSQVSHTSDITQLEQENLMKGEFYEPK